jgi:hypothetical protein
LIRDSRWIKLVNGRVPESEIARFLRRHPEQYQLNRADEAWFKGLFSGVQFFPRSEITDA